MHTAAMYMHAAYTIQCENHSQLVMCVVVMVVVCVLHSLKEHRIGTQCVVDIMQVVVGWCREEGRRIMFVVVFSCCALMHGG